MYNCMCSFENKNLDFSFSVGELGGGGGGAFVNK